MLIDETKITKVLKINNKIKSSRASESLPEIRGGLKVHQFKDGALGKR